MSVSVETCAPERLDPYAWANKNRIPVEENKTEKNAGHYLHPEAFGQPEERGVDWANDPEQMSQIKQLRLDTEPSSRPRN